MESKVYGCPCKYRFTPGDGSSNVWSDWIKESPRTAPRSNTPALAALFSFHILFSTSNATENYGTTTLQLSFFYFFSSCHFLILNFLSLLFVEWEQPRDNSVIITTKFS